MHFFFNSAQDGKTVSFKKFQKSADVILKKHTPLKAKNVRAEQALINKITIKEIMKRLRLRNPFKSKILWQY